MLLSMLSWKFKDMLAPFFRPKGKFGWLRMLPSHGTILAVGCGANSPRRVKNILPNWHYIGLDVGDYNQSSDSKSTADEYIIVPPEEFAAPIWERRNRLEAVLSSHNLEHCKDRVDVLSAMCEALRVGGEIFLSFPSEASINFPNRLGPLNYYDDKTHQEKPPSFEEVLNILKEKKFEIRYASRQYRPKLLMMIGFLLEPLSVLFNRNFLGTWELFGFESIIHAVKSP